MRKRALTDHRLDSHNWATHMRSAWAALRDVKGVGGVVGTDARSIKLSRQVGVVDGIVFAET